MADPDRTFTVINPLGAALDHYARELTDVLERGGWGVRQLAIDEPSASGGSRVGWCRAYVRAIRHAGQTADPGAPVIVTWPVLGFLDVALLRLFAPRHRWCIVMHDPEPLVRAIGYGRFARALARNFGRDIEFVVHSRAGDVALRKMSVASRQSILPHPMLEPRPSGSPSVTDRPKVRVLGQYKADRDLEALQVVGEAVPDADLEIVGRGWPRVRGWSVRSAFVPEAEFDALIASSSVILIPYKRFFQSGVAVRATENSVPVVGERASSLGELLSTSSWLVDDEDWADAVRRAIGAGGQARDAVARAAYRGTVNAWRDWAQRVAAT